MYARSSQFTGSSGIIVAPEISHLQYILSSFLSHLRALRRFMGLFLSGDRCRCIRLRQREREGGWKKWRRKIEGE